MRVQTIVVKVKPDCTHYYKGAFACLIILAVHKADSGVARANARAKTTTSVTAAIAPRAH